MTYIDLFYFLGKCLALDDNEKAKEYIVSEIKQDEFAWERFVSLASDHLVLPSVYLRFKKNGILSFLPEELVDHLQLIYELNLQRNTSIIAQVEHINSLFHNSGISPIYLKGVGNILDGLYEDTGERMIGDIDLLVSEDEFLPAVNLLKGEGYEHEYPYFDNDRIMIKHYPRLVHPTEPGDVEVHRLPVDLNLSKTFNYAVIYPEKKQIGTDIPCYVLSDRHNAILNFMHGFMAREVKISRSVSFRNLNDLFLLSHRTDIYEVFEGMPKYTSQARIYADFMCHFMGLNKRYALAVQSKKFIRRFELIYKSRFLYRVFWILRYLSSRIWSAYICNITGAFFSKRKRQMVIRKLSDPSWYKIHFKSYIDGISQNFGERERH